TAGILPGSSRPRGQIHDPSNLRTGLIPPRTIDPAKGAPASAVRPSDQPAHAGAGARRDVSTLGAEALRPISASRSVAAWRVLVRWYDLEDKYAIPYFAFEKVPGQFHSDILRRTLALFIGCALAYAGGALLIARARQTTV